MALTKTPIELSSTPSIVDGGNATAITIDSSENVLVGTTSTATQNLTSGGGTVISATGGVASAYQSVSASDPVVSLNNTGVDSSIITFRKDGTAVGSIASISNDLVIYSSTASHAGLSFGNTRIEPTNNQGVIYNGGIDLGNTDSRFKDIYLAGGAYLGGTGAANKLEDYEEGSWTPTVAGCSISVGRASYTKIGNLVTLHFNISVTATDNASVAFSIGGKPFQGSSGDAESAGSLMGQYITTVANTINLNLYTFTNNSTLEIYQTQSNNGVWVTLKRSQVAANATAIIGSITYQTNA